jgi:uncharacterized protein (DUF58 family)
VTDLLSRASSKFFSAFLTLLLAGAFLGNTILIYASLIPLFTVALALTFSQPSRVIVSRAEKEMALYVDDDAGISLRVEIPDGVGLVTLADTPPKHFKLVGGNNFRVFWKGFGKEIVADISYKVRCTRRGVYQLSKINWESIHPLFLKQTKIGSSKDALRLIVRHRPLAVRKIRGVRTFSKIPLPSESSAKMGVATTDFREIRDYLPGDPYRSINWKATAKLVHSHKKWLPKVNEFEREGKRVVWIFLDKSAGMSLGSTIKNSLEYAVQAATALTRFYLERDCRVGLCVYGSKGAERIVLPDVGNRQYYRILKELTALEPEDGQKSTDSSTSLRNAVKKCRGHLVGSNPLSIIITSVSARNVGSLVEGVKEMRKCTLRRGTKESQVIVIHVAGNHIAARDDYEGIAADLMELENRYVIWKVRRAGARVVSWNPMRHSLAKLLLTRLRS